MRGTRAPKDLKRMMCNPTAHGGIETSNKRLPSVIENYVAPAGPFVTVRSVKEWHFMSEGKAVNVGQRGHNTLKTQEGFSVSCCRPSIEQAQTRRHPCVRDLTTGCVRWRAHFVLPRPVATDRGTRGVVWWFASTLSAVCEERRLAAWESVPAVQKKKGQERVLNSVVASHRRGVEHVDALPGSCFPFWKGCF